MSRLESLEKRQAEKKMNQNSEHHSGSRQQSNVVSQHFENRNGKDYTPGKTSYKNYKNKSKYNPNVGPYAKNLPFRTRNNNRFNPDGPAPPSVSEENFQSENDTRTNNSQLYGKFCKH